MQEQSRANTEERQNLIRQRCTNDAIKLSENHVAIYNERFKSEAIFLRGESLFRLPKEYRSKIAPPILFEFPQNLIGMDMIATSIELLGKAYQDGRIADKGLPFQRTARPPELIFFLQVTVDIYGHLVTGGNR